MGTVKGTVTTGRILIGIEAAAGPSGTFALAYIDSSGLHEITTQPDFTLAHSVWATTDSVVFDSERAGDRHLFRMTIADGSVTQITSELRTAQQDAAILPDGRIVHDQYSCATPVDLGLHITAADGSSNSQLTPARPEGDPGYDQQPAVSPNGQQIVFVRNVDDNTAGLFLVPVAGGTATRLTADALHVNYPRWSPDGKSILFTQYKTGANDELWTVPVTGGDPKQLTHSPAGAMSWEGDWSPDGTQVVYKYYQQGWKYNELHTANADGSNESVLWTGDYSTAETPDWGP